MLGIAVNDTDNLKDFYAGLAMLGILSAGHQPAYVDGIAETAHDIAESMMRVREERMNGERNRSDA